MVWRWWLPLVEPFFSRIRTGFGVHNTHNGSLGSKSAKGLSGMLISWFLSASDDLTYIFWWCFSWLGLAYYREKLKHQNPQVFGARSTQTHHDIQDDSIRSCPVMHLNNHYQGHFQVIMSLYFQGFT